MTTETALATREYSDRELQQRIKLNQQAGYGLEKASPAALNIVFLMCQRYGLDPVSDLTLFEGRPFITIDGRLRLLRRHPEYRGYTCRPLSKDEKIAWGYEPEDIVVECTIRTTTWGEISARGKVTAVEVEAARARAQREGKRSAPIGVHPVEIAEKRAVARAERAAFGQDALPDDDEIAQTVTTVIQERTEPERVRRESAEYDRIASSFYEEHTSAPAPTGAVAEDVSAAPPDADTSTDTIDAPLVEAFQRNMALSMVAAGLDIKGIGHLRAKDDWTLEQVTEANDKLAAKMNASSEAQGAF